MRMPRRNDAWFMRGTCLGRQSLCAPFCLLPWLDEGRACGVAPVIPGIWLAEMAPLLIDLAPRLMPPRVFTRCRLSSKLARIG